MSTAFTALLPLDHVVAVDADALLRSAQAYVPDMPGRKQGRIAGGLWGRVLTVGPASGREICVLEFDGVVVSVSVTDQPIPAETLRPMMGGTRNAGVHLFLAQPRPHALVRVTKSAAGFAGAVAAARALTAVAAAILGLTPAIAVYWATGMTTTVGADFVAGAQQMLRGQLPTKLWVAFSADRVPPNPGGENNTVATSEGMAPFIGGGEVVCLQAPITIEEAIRRVAAVVNHIFTRGPLVGDSDTIDLGPDERLHLRNRETGNPPARFLTVTVERSKAAAAPARSADVIPIHGTTRPAATTMPDEPPPDDSYGPDRTLAGIADWLSENAALIRAYFAEAPAALALRIVEKLTEQHPKEEFEGIKSGVTFEYLLYDGTILQKRDPHGAANATVEDLKVIAASCAVVAAAGPTGDLIRRRCVITDDIYFNELYELTLRRDGTCQGRIRYHNFEIEQTKDEEKLEQYFAWARQGARYVGQRIELRLWSPYIPEFIAGPERDKQALLEDPAAIYTHAETVPYRDEGYRSLFLMRRPPDRIRFESGYIALLFDGEHPDLRSQPQPQPLGQTAGARRG